MGNELTQLLGNFVLAALMLVVGLELTLADFRRVVATPRAVVAGTLAQIALLPLLTWGIVALFGVSPVFGAGAVLVALSPGAGLSNVLAAVSGANIALSVTLTAMTSVLSVVTLPIVASFALQHFLQDASTEVRVGPLVEQLAFVLLLPIVAGMTVRARFPSFVHRNKRSLQRIAAGVIGLLFLGIVALSVQEGQTANLRGIERALAAAAAWTLAAMVVGWGVASLLSLSTVDRATFLIEFSARNLAVASIVALSGLERIDLTLFSAAYGAIGFPMVIVAAVVLRRRLVTSPARTAVS